MEQTEKPKKSWPKSYLALPLRYRRINNNFFGSRMPDGDKADKVTDWDKYEGNKANWAYDCRLYNCPPLIQDYHKVRSNYCKYGPIPEKQESM